jgi:hypothetical protein
MEDCMYAVRIRVDRVIDFGTIVSLVGIDLETEKPVAVHVDLRPLAELDQATLDAGLQRPIMYDAGGCTLTLTLGPTEAEEVTHG